MLNINFSTPSNKNIYFDVDIRKSKSETLKLCVMDASEKAEFEEHQTQKNPVRCSFVSPTKSLVFFNKRSQVSISKQLDFLADDVDAITIEDIKKENPLGIFTIIGEVLWLEPAHAAVELNYPGMDG